MGKDEIFDEFPIFSENQRTIFSLTKGKVEVSAWVLFPFCCLTLACCSFEVKFWQQNNSAVGDWFRAHEHHLEQFVILTSNWPYIQFSQRWAAALSIVCYIAVFIAREDVAPLAGPWIDIVNECRKLYLTEAPGIFMTLHIMAFEMLELQFSLRMLYHSPFCLKIQLDQISWTLIFCLQFWHCTTSGMSPVTHNLSIHMNDSEY